MEVTKQLIDYALSADFDSIPEEVIEVQKKAFIDGLAVMLAATSLGEGCAPFIEFAKQDNGNGGCTVVGSGFKASPVMAALANGSLAHALDFEDAHDKALIHSNAVTIPAIMAAAETRGEVSGKELLAAMVIGSDIACRLSLALNEDLIGNGWYMPPIHESVGAALAVGKILGLDEGQMLDAVTLDINQVTCSGELVNSPKSVMRSVRDGFAAKGAVLSGLLAQSGVKARFDKPLEGKLGYYHSYANGDYSPERLVEGLGEYYESAQISFKPWPSCRGTHPSVEGVIHIMKDNGICTDEVESIHLKVSKLNEMLLTPSEAKYSPTNAIGAKFSIPYTVSCAALYGTLGLESFLPEALKDEKKKEFAQKITYEVNAGLAKHESLHTEVTLCAAGKEYHTKVEAPKGNKTNPMSEAELMDKFRGCAKFAAKKYSEKEIETLLEKLGRLEECKDIKEITTLL